MPPTILSAVDIVKSYSKDSIGDTPVLRGVSVEVERGEFLALVGASGAGKSTLLHILASIDLPDSGSVLFTVAEKTYTYTTMEHSALCDLRNKHIGFVFQFHHLLPEFTAIENVILPLLIGGAGRSEAKRIALPLLERVGLAHRAEHFPNELSGGEQQRIAIARALVNKPSILFADEPTGNLDSANTESVLKLLKDLQEEFGISLIIATHSEIVAGRASRIVRMRDGHISNSEQRAEIDEN